MILSCRQKNYSEYVLHATDTPCCCIVFIHSFWNHYKDSQTHMSILSIFIYFRTLPDAFLAHSLGIEVFTVGITNLVNITEVKLMSSEPRLENETFWLLPDFQSLPTIIRSMSLRLCSGIESIINRTGELMNTYRLLMFIFIFVLQTHSSYI